MEKIALYDKFSKCHDCHLGFVEMNKKSRLVYEIHQSKVMFVGISPSISNDLTTWHGSKFGAAFESQLEAAGIASKDVYFTNLLKCRIPGNGIPQNDYILHCRKYLMEEISIVKPKMVVAMGKMVQDYLPTKDLEEMKIKISKIHHPSYPVYYNEDAMPEQIKMLKEIAKFLYGD